MSDNPYAHPESTNEPGADVSIPTWHPFRLVLKSLAGIFAAAVVVALLLPATQRNARGAARRTVCKNNLKQIGLALANYVDRWNALPPAYTVDANGRPLHSWRTLILPYVGEESLYHSIDLSKPWNDPANAKAYNSAPPVYRCPSVNSGFPKNHTTYLAVVAPGGCFLPSESRKIAELTDGTSQTMAVIEVDPKDSVHWMAPSDADEGMILEIGPKSKLAHTGGVHALFADGSVRFLIASLSPAVRQALISVSGDDDPGDF